jgi:hypothetical protein
MPRKVRELIAEALDQFRTEAAPKSAAIESWMHRYGWHRTAGLIRKTLVDRHANVTEETLYARKDLAANEIQRQRLALVFNLQEILRWTEAAMRGESETCATPEDAVH